VTLKTALLQGQKLLQQAGVGEPRLTAEVLLAHATQRDRVWLTAHAHEELIELWWIHYGRYLHQRSSGVPTQYITGRQEFYGRDFRVTPDVLIPRPETEHLIEAALRVKAATMLDIGTGSGAIAITLALETAAQVSATDVSASALAVAMTNAQRLGANVRWLECDLLPEGERFDLILSNPPYVAIADRETLQREVRDHEPALALFAGEDGLDVYRRLIPRALAALHVGGWLMLEIGAGQVEAVSAMLTTWTEHRIHNLTVERDLAGLPRVVLTQRA
jgi:release factor glutamine methyltransferase